MGYRIACIAVDIDKASRARELLSLTLTSEADEYCEAASSGGETANGKYVIWRNTDRGDFSQNDLIILSESMDFLFMETSETTMSGCVQNIQGGIPNWRIDYTGHTDPRTFVTSGTVPKEILDMKDLFWEKQALEENHDVDIKYEIISSTFAHFTGLKYDHGHDFHFFELAPAAPLQTSSKVKKPWWKFSRPQETYDMNMTRVFLLINAIGWAAFGLYSFFQPSALVDMLGADMVSADGLFELRSIYGGTSLGAAALFLAGFLKKHMERPALYFIVAYMGGYAAARLGAALLTGMPGPSLMLFWAIEIIGAGMSLYLLRKQNA